MQKQEYRFDVEGHTVVVEEPREKSGGIIIISLLLIASIVGVIVAGLMILHVSYVYEEYRQHTIITITGKTSYTISQGFFSSRTGFFVVTDKGTFEVGRSGGKEADVYALWSRLEVGHTYDVDIAMDLLIGAKEVSE